MRKTGRYYWLNLISYSCLVPGMIIILLFEGTVTTSIAGMAVGMLINGASNGSGITTSLVSLIANVDPADQAVATACFYLFRQLGSVTGLAISATVTNQLLRSSLNDALNDSENPDRIAEGVRQSLSYIKTLTPEVQEIVRDCYSRSVRGAFGAETIIVLGAGISALFIKEKLLSR